MERKIYLVVLCVSDGSDPEGLVVSDTSSYAAASQVVALKCCAGVVIFVSCVDTSEYAFFSVRAKVPTEQLRPSAAQGKRGRSGACDENESA